MKRFVLMLAVVALVATMSPITAAHAADDVNVRVINAQAVAVDVWVDSLVKTQNLAAGASTNIFVGAGSHNVVVCNINSQATPSTGAGCNQAGGTLPVLNPGFQAFDWAGGTHNTIVTGAGPNMFGFTQDLSETVAGNFRFELLNATNAAPLNVCFDGQGQKITAVPPLAPGTTMAHGSEVEGAAGQPVSVRVSPVANCVGATAILLNLAAGTNTVFTVTQSALVTTGGVEVLVIPIGQVKPQNVPVQSAFCTTLLSLQAIQAQYAATFANVKAGDPATSPSKFQVKSLVDTINAAVKSGDTHVTNLEKNFWQQATKGLSDLAAGLTAAGFDFNVIPNTSPAFRQQAIIDGSKGLIPLTQDQATAREALTAFAVANCLSASTVKGSGPKFTG